MGPSTTKNILAGIRLVNGALALLSPDILSRRLGVSTQTSPGLGYAFRLFGVRTVLIAGQLFTAPNDAQNHAIRAAVAIHAADTAAAITVYRRGELPPRGALLAIAMSATNTALAVILNYQLGRESQ